MMIDPTVHNASRIIKAYGTVAPKEDELTRIAIALAVPVESLLEH